jgi:hypothetical protein
MPPRKIDYTEYSEKILMDVKETQNENTQFDITEIANFFHKMSYMSPSDLMNEYFNNKKKKSNLSKCFDVSVKKF